jgi:2-dehydro-3-deoxyphosphogluconate aldolase/(4S)-4-hydroxy-2-oxoglutarate aldolase
MAYWKRLDVYNKILEQGLVPLNYHPDVEVMKKLVAAVVNGGSNIFEFTNRGDGAFKVFEELLPYCRKEYPELVLGVGSILEPGTGSIYISLGADFIVGSVYNPDLNKICNRRKIAYIPGCGSASEISFAEESGVEIVKVFPGGSMDGPKFVKSILGPTPWSLIMPTGGVTADKENIKAWFDAGVAAVGMGSAIFRKDWIKASDYDEISKLIRTIMSWIKELR